MRSPLSQLSVLAALMTAFLATGCGILPQWQPPPVELQAYNALTGEPLKSVTVARWEGKDPVRPDPIATTGDDGLIGAAIGLSAPSFIFEKNGYQPTEVRVEGDEAYIAGPSAGLRWQSHGGYALDWPTPRIKSDVYFEEDVCARPLIRVPMWPDGSTTVPTALSREHAKERKEPPRPFLELQKQ